MNRTRTVVCVFGLLILVASLAACGGAKKEQGAPRAAAVPVAVATVAQRNVPVEVTAIGTVEAVNSVAVKSQIAGELTSVNFTEGQDVKKGQLLFTMDRRPLQADLRRAEATLTKDMATAANDKAQAERYAALMKEGVVSRQMADQMVATANASEALVKADHAAVENARVQLQYTSIYSPIDGKTGNLAVQRGNVVKSNETVLVNINQIHPIYATFTVPEQMLSEIKRYSAQGNLKVAARIPNDPQGATGTLTFIDNAVDRQTGTIRLKATFDNADRRLWPGQFVNVTMTLTTQPNAITVPAVAVQNGQQGQFVFVVKGDKTVEPRPVQVARTLGQDAIVAKGLQPGETVVTDGQLRLTPNAKVDIKTAPGAPAQGTPATEASNQGSRS